MSVALVGLGVTVVVILFGVIAFVDGWREALVVIGGTVAFLAMLAGVAVFWLWIGGVLS